jgi:hypothetical protein
MGCAGCVRREGGGLVGDSVAVILSGGTPIEPPPPFPAPMRDDDASLSSRSWSAYLKLLP